MRERERKFRKEREREIKGEKEKEKKGENVGQTEMETDNVERQRR